MSWATDAAQGVFSGGLEALRRRHAFALGGCVDFSPLIPCPEPGAGYSHVVLHSSVWLDGALHVADISGQVAILAPGAPVRLLGHPELRYSSSLAWNPHREVFASVVAVPGEGGYKAALCELDMECSLQGVQPLPEDMRLPFETLVHEGDMFICDTVASRVHVLDASTLQETRRLDVPNLTPLLVRSGQEGVYLANCRRGQWVPGRHAPDLRQRIWLLDAEHGDLNELLRFHETQSLIDFCFLGPDMYVLLGVQGNHHYLYKYDASLEPVFRVDVTRRLGGRETSLRSMSPGPGRVFIGGYAGTPLLLEILLQEGETPMLPVGEEPWS